MTERSYLDVNATDLDAEGQELVAAQRRTYDADKAARKALVEYFNRRVPMANGDAVMGVHYTRWGQMQISIGEKTTPKAKASARPSLSAYLAQQAANGR